MSPTSQGLADSCAGAASLLNRRRSILTGDEVLTMQEAQLRLAEDIAEFYGSDDGLRAYLEREAGYFDPRIQISKSYPYRRFMERRAAPYTVRSMPPTILRTFPKGGMVPFTFFPSYLPIAAVLVFFFFSHLAIPIATVPFSSSQTTSIRGPHNTYCLALSLYIFIQSRQFT